jgi:hypothetical protein
MCRSDLPAYLRPSLGARSLRRRRLLCRQLILPGSCCNNTKDRALLAQTREEGAGSPGALQRGSDVYGVVDYRFAVSSKRVAKQPQSAYPWLLDGTLRYDNRKETQALMAEPIKLEIFTDYV